ncbi:hypothetical protein BDQ17DRAFT_1205212, partial [Cyathus striatus]
VYFQQNYAPSYMSKSTQAWFECTNIIQFPHPSTSPDLNLIEPVWHEPKKVVRSLPHCPTSVGELTAAVHTTWESLPFEVINRHVGNM